MRPMKSQAETSLRAALDFLSLPEAYPDRPDSVERIETHFAWVFLSRRLVYKLKKPITFRALDLTTLAARRANCELEVSLNRRLGEAVYIGVVPLCRRGSTWALEAEGDPVEWLVKMHRLPADRMLDRAAAAGTISDDDLSRLVDKLGAYYARAVRAPWGVSEYRAALERRIAEHGAELGAPALGLDGRLIRDLTGAQLRFVSQQAALLDARLSAGRVVDAHGDLRPEHVCLVSDVQIIDCLEFSAELRLLDTIEEIAFLALECERLGHADIGRRIVDLYRERCIDRAPPELLGFYRSVRAVTRALISILRVPEVPAEARARWRERAAWYLAAAGRALAASDGARASG
jgi:aminoglycoside phosphotransferase family enzyme